MLVSSEESEHASVLWFHCSGCLRSLACGFFHFQSASLCPLPPTAPRRPRGRGWVGAESYNTDLGSWWAKFSLLQKGLSYTGRWLKVLLSAQLACWCCTLGSGFASVVAGPGQMMQLALWEHLSFEEVLLPHALAFCFVGVCPLSFILSFQSMTLTVITTWPPSDFSLNLPYPF